MYIKKSIVQDSLLKGIPVAHRVIAKVGHNKRFITLRHPWVSGDSALGQVRDLYLSYAREISRKYKRQVEVRASSGATLAVICTEDEHGSLPR